MEICDKLRRDLAMVTYIYLNVNECWLTSSMPQQRFKLQISLNYAHIEQNAFSRSVVGGNVSFKAFRLMVAWPPSGPTTVVILVVDYISELTIHSVYVHPFCIKVMYNISFIVNLMQQIVHSW